MSAKVGVASRLAATAIAVVDLSERCIFILPDAFSRLPGARFCDRPADAIARGPQTYLKTSAAIVVMSYHSLEDQITKDALRKAATSSSPIELPVELPGTAPTLNIVTKGVERAGETELSNNPRAASARLRAAVKLEAAA